MVVQLVDHGIQLRLDSVSQKLKFVEITDFAKLELLYMDHTFRSFALPSLAVPPFL